MLLRDAGSSAAATRAAGSALDVLVGPVAGRRRDEQRDGVGVADDDGVAAAPARVPPVGSTRTRASKRSAPVMGRPSAVVPAPSPLTPRITRSPSAVASTVARCGVCIRASKEICPGRLAVSRTTMTWSGALANTSRENVTPPLV